MRVQGEPNRNHVLCFYVYVYGYVYVCTQWKEERARISCKHVPSGRFGLVF
jgi:hypothetical protein